MICMTANNNSPYSGYNEVNNKVEESGDQSEDNVEIGNCKRGCTYTYFHNFIIMWLSRLSVIHQTKNI